MSRLRVCMLHIGVLSSLAQLGAAWAPASTSISVNPAGSVTAFKNRWAQEEQAMTQSRLCGKERMELIARQFAATINIPPSSNGKEFCQKLGEKIDAKESVVGVFARCAARLDEASARTLDDCWVTPFSGGTFYRYWQSYQKGKVILLAGQGLNADGSVPPTLTRRAMKAAQLHKKYGIPVIVCGGDDRATGSTEAFGAAQVMQDHGVPAEAILYESQSTTSLENYWFAMKWIRRTVKPATEPGDGCESPPCLNLFVVTSDWHVPRMTFSGEVVMNYFKNSAGRTYVPRFFEDLSVNLKVVGTKSACLSTLEPDKADLFIGSNAAGFDQKLAGELTALTKHQNGPERVSVGEDTVDSNVWGVELDLPPGLLDKHIDAVAALKARAEKDGCTAPPDAEMSLDETDDTQVPWIKVA